MECSARRKTVFSHPWTRGFSSGRACTRRVGPSGGRAREPAKALDIARDVTDEELAARVEEPPAAAGTAESSIRIVVSAGVGSIDYRAGSASRPTVVVIVRPLPEYPDSLYREGARAVVVPMMRATRGGLDPRTKSSNPLTNLSALREAHRQKAYEAIMLNPAGEVAEGSMSNVFLVAKGVVRTPPISAGILEGITRELVIEVARENGYPVEEKGFKPDQLLKADEGFITASARQIVPIVQLNETRIGNGKPGPITRALIAAYKEKVQELIREKEEG